jgi:hypothetical protein
MGAKQCLLLNGGTILLILLVAVKDKN